MKNKDFSHVIFLENTQTIFSGIERLYELIPTKKANESYLDFVNRQWTMCFLNSSLGMHTNGRYQNPLYLFFQFLKEDPYWKEQDEIDDICKTSAAQMLALYDIVTNLSITTPKEEIPGQFDEFCCRMRDIMDSDVCYLLYSQRDQTELLSNSSFPVNMVSPPEQHDELDLTLLGQTEFDSLRLFIQRTRKNGTDYRKEDITGWHLADTIYVPGHSDLYAKGTEPGTQRNLVAIVLDLPATPGTGGQSEWIYVVFQYHDSVPTIESLLRRARNLLFLRNKITDHCSKHMYLLLIAQRTCHFIPRLNVSDNDDDFKIRILHLTDLHLRPNNCALAMDFASNIYSLKKNNIHGGVQPILRSPNSSEKTETPLVDLLVITGDVVQANYSAGLLEKNYELAEKFIRALAANLWKTNANYVRADWRKRIIITPGNHDYASMNELQAEAIPGSKRAIGVGYPAQNEGGPMVKFAYYINFLSRLFRTDINSLIHNYLNEMRCYRQLNLTVLSVNSVSEAGPLRTNKVLLNPLAGKKLIHSTDLKNQFPLLLSHHTPNYQINYLMDRYWSNCGVAYSTQCAWVEKFVECLEEISKLESITDSEILDKDLTPIRDKLDNICTTIIDSTSFTLANPEKNDLLWDIVRTVESIAKPPYISEQVASLCRRVLADKNMAERDSKLLNLNFKELLKTMHYQLVLGGHTHEMRLGGKGTTKTTDYTELDPKDIPFAEGGLFLKPQNNGYTIHMGILDLRRQSPLREWKVSAKYHPITYSSGTYQCAPRTGDTQDWTFYINPPNDI